MGANGNLGAIYAGRFIAGLGVGQTPVVGPVYIAEIAPASIRGLCTCIFTGFVYLGIVLAYFTNYGCQINLGDTTHARWLVPTSLHIMFAGIIFLLTFLQLESPRFLIKVGKREQALETLSKLRGLPVDHPYVIDEITTIDVFFQEEKEATLGMGKLGVVKEIFTIKRNAYRLFLTNLAQLLACFSGGSAITVYAPDLFKLVGITGHEQSLFSTVIFGIVKFVASIICARVMKISPVSLHDLDLANHHSIRLRIAVKPDAKHPGGINIFGRGFGNYDQDIILRLQTAD